ERGVKPAEAGVRKTPRVVRSLGGWEPDPSDLECGEPNDDDGDRGDDPWICFPGHAPADAAAARGGRAGEEDGPHAGPALHLRPGAKELAPPVPSGPGAPPFGASAIPPNACVTIRVSRAGPPRRSRSHAGHWIARARTWPCGADPSPGSCARCGSGRARPRRPGAGRG